MQKSILKPQNWQDFETLCKKLWSEEFESKSFKKNGRNGQKQDGVDIYGIPRGEENYYGIQCKLKTDSRKLIIKEIESEIAFAEKFEPSLEHLIIASTTLKDVEIEGFVRKQNLERKEQGKFGVELCCWEDIESLLRENYQTYQWYLNNLDVQKRYAVQVCFDNEKTLTTIKPKLLKRVKKYVYFFPKKEVELTEYQKKSIEIAQNIIKNVQIPNLDNLQKIVFKEKCKLNCAWCNFKLFFRNCGGNTLKHWKLRFYVDKKDGVFYDESEGNFSYLLLPQKKWETEWEDEFLYADPEDKPFLQNDVYNVNFSFRPNIGVKKISIKWELLAEDFSDKGELFLIVKPEIVEKEEVVEVFNRSEEKTEEMPLEYFFDYPGDSE